MIYRGNMLTLTEVNIIEERGEEFLISTIPIEGCVVRNPNYMFFNTSTLAVDTKEFINIEPNAFNTLVKKSNIIWLDI